jgi:glycosyltransferase involved in cell wall biosynthesis
MVEHPWQFPYVVKQVQSESVLVYSSHNFEPELYQHLSDRTIGSLVYRWIKRIERRAVEESDLVVVTSEHDLQQYQSHYNRDDGWHVARNGVSSNDIVPPSSPRNLSSSSQEELSAIFVGSNHPPNVEAAEYIFHFARELGETNVHFDIIGTVADAFETEAVPANVTIHGYVETLSDYYREADIGLNPITSGSGSNLKLVEYLSNGVPVVSTPFGTRGFPFEDGRHLIVTNIDSFTQEIRRAGSDQQKLYSLVSRAQGLIERELVWDEISSDMCNTIKNNLNK